MAMIEQEIDEEPDFRMLKKRNCRDFRKQRISRARVMLLKNKNCARVQL